MVGRDVATGGEMIWSKASLSDPSRSGWPYIDLFHLAAGLAHRRERVLFVGSGGAVGPRQFAAVYPGIQIDLVESDPTVIELARALYAIGEIPNLSLHVADGVSFVARAPPRSWDIVVVDAYDAGELASGFSARAFFARVNEVLRSGGTMAFNVVGSLDGDRRVRAVADAATKELRDVRLVPVMTPNEAYDASAVRNVVIIGLNRE